LSSGEISWRLVKGKFTAEAQRTPRLRREGEREKRKARKRLSLSPSSPPISAKSRRSLRLCGELGIHFQRHDHCFSLFTCSTNVTTTRRALIRKAFARS